MLSMLALLAAIVLAGPARAETPTEKLDAYYNNLAAEGRLNGAVLVAQDGKVVYAKGFGQADFEVGKANTLDTAFETASISKVFTATAVLQMVERGKVDLDSPISRYLKDFPYPAITVRQLLSHSSGMSDQDLEPSMRAYAKTIAPRPMGQADLVPALQAGKVAFKLKPGERWWYANIGYQLLARLVETVSGQTFDAYVRDRIARPAGMTHTSVVSAAHPSTSAAPYDYEPRYAAIRTRLKDEPSNVMGAAGVVTTVGDLLKFDQALRANKLLGPKTQAIAYTPDRLADGQPVSVWLDIGGMGPAEDGLGWFVFKDRTHGKVVWHTGGAPGCATIFLRALDEKRTVIVLDNTNSEGLYKAGLSALRILDGEPPLNAPLNLARIYARTLSAQGPDAAFARLATLRDDTSRYVLRENDLNNLAYKMLEDGRLPLALEAFKVNAALFPASDNVWNSYAEALEKAGRLGDALALHRKAVTLNPDNADSKAAIARLSATP
ncbi:serine hydrolase [Caulobacter segnis]|uniref:Beta-lactamase n=2 Tax=Caulobacter segnis TaxID=88688 RepID=D5VFL7_CAUST|nr:serine hydrolase domain-containing protein [Caulobacter segnis]ADG09749.1 beta-lactamase [Caulobacter segnis ATCC 21756]AVQ01522.1 serine hydrolase [Caulobacter segnis]